MWWLLAREVLRLRGTISRDPERPWHVKVHFFFYREPEEVIFSLILNEHAVFSCRSVISFL
jgi:hypothetical protein